MSAKTNFGCLPTVIGSMPHTDPQEACRLLLRYLPAIPAWPQLPKRSFTETMYAQYSEGLPGIDINVEEQRIYVDRSQDMDSSLEELHRAFVENDSTQYVISADYAAGLHAFLDSILEPPLAVKGQVTGPISLGLSLTDGTYYVVYDDTLAEALARHLRLKASWQEHALRRKSPNVIIFVDEPYLTSLGTSFVSLPWEKVSVLLEETLGGIQGIRGLHCCGRADWSLLLSLPIDILSFDTYNYTESLGLYPAEAKSFLEKGGSIAWGIVPNDEDSLAKETVASLKDRLEEAIAPLARDGIRFPELVEKAILTPSCSLATLSTEAAELALELLSRLSSTMRKRYLV